MPYCNKVQVQKYKHEHKRDILNLTKQKFSDPHVTATGQTRAYVDLKELKTLWFNTGTQCNLQCENCYIESSPTNDRLVYLSPNDLLPYLNEIHDLKLPTELIAFTGGEPFINPNIQDLIEQTLSYGFPLLILTNAYKILKRHQDFLLNINQKYPDKLYLRVSLDHYTKEVHEKERSIGTFDKTLAQIKWLADHDFNLSIAARSLVDQNLMQSLEGYQSLFDSNQIKLNLILNDNIVIFPEMIPDESVPEITTECWSILNKSPDMQMCATQRMIVKRKGSDKPVVLPCTLLAYDKQFDLGTSLQESKKRVQLNHVYCAKFCVLGGSSCTNAK